MTYPYLPAVPIGEWDVEKGALVRQHQDPLGPQRPVPVLPILRGYRKTSAVTSILYKLGRATVDKFFRLRRRMMAAQTPDQQIVGLIAEAAARLFRVPPAEIFRPSRGHALSALARQSVMYVLHVTLGWTQARVAVALHRDRTTVLHGCRTVEDTRDEPEFDVLIAQLEAVAAGCEDIEARHMGAAA